MANGSSQVSAAVSENGCRECKQYVSERHQLAESTRRSGFYRTHCINCHSGTHVACFMCGACLPKWHRYERRYCSSTCRVRAYVAREEAAMERAAWEAENPEEARRQVEESEQRMRTLEAALGGVDVAQRIARDRREQETHRVADRCAERIWHQESGTLSDCGRPFAPGDVIYRRRRGGPRAADSPVLPYCYGHRCTQRDGYHNVDAGENYHYPACRCEDSHWEKPQPCPGCARPVSHPKYAAWLRGRDWHYAGKETPARPRPFCSERCRRIVHNAERKAKRLAERRNTERRCQCCNAEVKGRRGDATYCSAACRQRAYRRKRGKIVSFPTSLPAETSPGRRLMEAAAVLLDGPISEAVGATMGGREGVSECYR